jgi:hypothetical protein
MCSNHLNFVQSNETSVVGEAAYIETDVLIDTRQEKERTTVIAMPSPVLALEQRKMVIYIYIYLYIYIITTLLSRARPNFLFMNIYIYIYLCFVFRIYIYISKMMIKATIASQTKQNPVVDTCDTDVPEAPDRT